MNMRSTQGASLFLVSTVSIIIIIVGIGLYFLFQQFGGFRELQHATDSGNLNVAKQALKMPHFATTAYQSDFAGLIDPDPNVNGMDLLTYNRVVGQAYLVAINALADSSTGNPNPLGLANAALVAQAANGGSGSNVGVGKQLYQALADTSPSNPLVNTFLTVANGNSTYMMGHNPLSSNGWDVSFIGAPASQNATGDPTNVYVSYDPNNTNLPYMGNTNVRAGDPNNSASLYSSVIQPTLNTSTNTPVGANSGFIAGYTPINFSAAGTSWTLYGVPVYPNSQPHHVSGRDFYGAKTQWASTFAPNGQGIVPPNAFKSIAAASDKTANAQTYMEAYSVVGAQNATYPLQIPAGFLVIYNPRGATASGYTPSQTLTANQLGPPNGIILAHTRSGQPVFSTDGSTLQAWANYNNPPPGQNPGNPAAPALLDRQGQPVMFMVNPDGSTTAITSRAQASQITGMGATAGSGPVMNNCLWTSISDGTYDGTSPGTSTCDTLYQSFNNAYYPNGSIQGTPVSGGGALMAVEKLKEDVLRQFNRPGCVPCSVQSTGLRAWTAALPYPPGGYAMLPNGQFTPTPPSDNSWISPSGRSGLHTMPGGATAQISVNGNLSQLLAEATNGQQDVILNQLAQRMTEIDPPFTQNGTQMGTTQGAAYNWLTTNNTPITLSTSDSFFYIYHTGGPGINGWVFSSSPPPWVHTSISAVPLPGTLAPDGTPQSYSSGQYDLINGDSNTPGFGVVNPEHEIGIHQQLFTAPPPAGSEMGEDQAIWIPSSGYGNLLGLLEFRNVCTSTGNTFYSQPD